jgi:heptosyltransferase-2
MATPALRAIRERFGDARLGFVGRPFVRGLVGGSQWCDEFLEWEPKRRGSKLAALFGLASELRKRSYECSVLLTNSFRSALLVRLAGIRRRVGYSRDGRGWLLTDRLAVPTVEGRLVPTPMVVYYGGLAERLGCPPPGDRLVLCTSESDERAISERLAGLGIGEHYPLVVIAPGASFGASKLWLPERFAELGDRLVRQRNAAVVISCAPGEQEIARRIGMLMKKRAHVLDDPVTTLGEFASLIRRCDLLVNNDTGPRHMAKAFGRSVVTVFGPTHPGWTDTNYPWERKVSIPVDCGPCQQKVCPLGHLKCMTGVTVDMVESACNELLDAGRDEGVGS